MELNQNRGCSRRRIKFIINLLVREVLQYGGDQNKQIQYGGDQCKQYGGGLYKQYGGDQYKQHGGDQNIQYSGDQNKQYGGDQNKQYGRDQYKLDCGDQYVYPIWRLYLLTRMKLNRPAAKFTLILVRVIEGLEINQTDKLHI